MDEVDESEASIAVGDRPSDVAIVWEAVDTPLLRTPGASSAIGAPTVQKARFGDGVSHGTASITRLVHRLAAILTNPTFIQLHGRSPMETSRIATTTVSDAADALGRSDNVEWGRGRAAGNLDLGPFRVAAKELGQPRLADGVLSGQGFRPCVSPSRSTSTAANAAASRSAPATAAPEPLDAFATAWRPRTAQPTASATSC